MTSGEPTAQSLHHDVQAWLGERALWDDELEAWLKEHAESLSKLAAIEQTLHRFADAARKHQRTLAAYKPRLNAFEHKLAKYLQGDERQSLPALAAEHTLLASEHQVQRKHHQEALSLFRAMMAEMDLLRKALTA
jgi:hypothetical protein